jgi:hypothetical protein
MADFRFGTLEVQRIRISLCLTTSTFRLGSSTIPATSVVSAPSQLGKGNTV